ncbi:putative PAP-specific phosphatase, mitochondrial, partial [Cucurbita argyrosperma subsp. sororia]
MAVRFATDRWTRLFSPYLCNSTQPVLQHKNTKYRRELEAAVDVVQRAFRILVDVLNPIDCTRGFLRGNDVLYVVGLAPVVEGEIVLGVMECPNCLVDLSGK